MRDILFRGKRVDNGEWVYGFYYHGDYKIGSYIIPLGNDECLDVEVEVIPESVGQLTGLTDKNGNKIFEGDILTKKWKAFVFWCKVDLQFKVKIFNNPTVNKIRPLKEFVIQRELAIKNGESEIIIIGNIHDNPELLEK